MHCPLGRIGCQSGAYYTVTTCSEEDCGFWDKENNCCAIITIAKSLDAIQ